MPPLSSLLHTLQRRRRWLYGGAALVVLHAVAGFWILPTWAERRLPKLLEATLGRRVRLARVQFNPYTWRARVQGFAILEPDGQVLLGWDQLTIRVRPGSLLGREFRIRDLTVDGLSSRLALLPNGQTNLSDILQRIAAAQPAPSKSNQPGRGVCVEHLSLRGAATVLEDLRGTEPFRERLGPWSLELQDLRTLGGLGKAAFTARLRQGARFVWTGTVGLAPLQSHGAFSLDQVQLAAWMPYLRPFVRFDLRSGQADLEGRYAFEAGTAEVLRVAGLSMRLRNLALGAPEHPEAAIVLDAVDVKDLTADVPRHVLDVGSVRLTGGRWTLQRRENGTLDLAELLQPKPRPELEAPTTPWSVAIHRIALSNQRIDFEDRTTTRPVRLQANLTAVNLDQLLPNGAPSPFAATLVMADGGTLRLEGTLTPSPFALTGRLTLQAVGLAPLAPYARPFHPAALAGGKLSATLDVTLPHPTLTGRLDLTRVKVMDPTGTQAWVSWNRLGLQGLALQMEPLALNIQSARLEQPNIRLQVDPQGTLNLMPPASTAPASETPTAAAAAIHLDRFQLQGGSVFFQDQSVVPEASVALEDLSLEATQLGTRASAAATLALKAKVDGTAPLSIQGRFNLLAPGSDSTLRLEAHAVDLVPASPYAQEHLAYPILKGKLDLTVDWKVRQRQLQALHHLRLDQLQLGSKVAAPQALKLPIKLGLALLRDRHGVIDVELPVEGHLDAPDFKLRKAIWKAVGRLFTKLATAPFDALTHLAGTNIDLSQATCTPGVPTLTEAGRTAVAALIQALQQRPSLSVDLEGTADPAVDGPVLKHQALDALLARTRGTEGPITDAERPTLIQAAWIALTHPQGTPPSPTPEAAVMLQALEATLPSQESRVAALATRRALQVQEQLIQAGIEPGRVFRTAVAPNAPHCGVRFQLRP